MTISTIAALLTLFTLNTAHTTVVVDATPGQEIGVVYYGRALSDLSGWEGSGVKPQRAYPCRGTVCDGEYALSVIFPDGNNTLDVSVTSSSLEKWEDGEILRVTSRDRHYPLELSHCFKTFRDEDIVEAWTEIRNTGRDDIILTRYYSACLPIRTGEMHVSSFSGFWSDEAHLVTERLARGIKTIRNQDGTRGGQSSRAEVMISLDGAPDESRGRHIGAALEWGGPYDIVFESTSADYVKLLAGICPEGSEYVLGGGRTLVTPPLALSFSKLGQGQVSRNFHRWGRGWRLWHPDVPKQILLNSWEGVYLDVNEAVIREMMRDFAAMGGELFVLDDGWFGDKYSRTRPDASLGDWRVDRTKLPGGFTPLIEQARSLGIGFGIWVEPEMANTRSAMYEAHPDWVLKSANRPVRYGRGGTQVVLDLCNPEVQDYIVSVFDTLLKENPGISYIKWDCNAPMQWGSQYLSHQGNLAVDYWIAFGQICDRIRASHPDIVMQACASGGGRINWGILPWFDEFWTSDNTDACQRLRIQWGTSMFYPASAMGSHICGAPNRVTGGVTPIKYRIDVAMSGRLGMELQPGKLSERERAQCTKAIDQYKRIRHIVQGGDLYRLSSPYGDSGTAALMYVTPDRDEAVLFWYKTDNSYAARLPRTRLEGLDARRSYLVTELDAMEEDTPLACEGKTMGGDLLMNLGLEFPLRHSLPKEMATDYSSRVLYLSAQ